MDGVSVLTGLILGVSGGIIGGYVWNKFIIGPHITHLHTMTNNHRILLTGLFKDGSVIYAIQNVFAQRIEDIEDKLDIESLSPEDYSAIQAEVIAALDNRINNPIKDKYNHETT